MKTTAVIFALLLWPIAAIAAISTGPGGIIFNDATTQTTAANGLKWVSVEEYGADGSDASDDTAGVRAAFASGYNVYFPAGGVFYLTDAITCNTPGQLVSGDRIYSSGTVIIIDSSFDGTEDGVFIVDDLDPGPVFRNLYVGFDQEEASGITMTDPKCTSYEFPPLFYINDSPGTKIQDSMIVLAYQLAEVYGDANNVGFSNIRFDSFMDGIYIGAATGVVRISDVHYWLWCVGSGSANCVISGIPPADIDWETMRNIRCGATIKIESGATVLVDNFFTDQGIGLYIDNDGTGNKPTVMCDTYLTEAKNFPFKMLDGYLLLTNSKPSTENNVTPSYRYYDSVDSPSPMMSSGGYTLLSNCDIEFMWQAPSGETELPNFVIKNGASVQITGSRFYKGADASQSEVVVENGGVLMLNGCLFQRPDPAGDRPGELFEIQSGGLLSMYGSRGVNQGGDRGLVDLQGDNEHNLYSNAWGGWIYDDPPTTSNVEFNYNIDYNIP